MEERFKVCKRAGIFGIIGNIFLFIIKIIVGITFKSQSMIADSLNSLGDIFASFMTWIGNKISSVPKDEDHNYGHGKAEYIFSMLISISMIVVAVKLLWDSVMSIVNSNKLDFSILLVIVCIITIITKLCLYLYTRSLYKKYDNLLVKANMEDHRNDMVVTSLTLLAIVLTKFNIYFVDGIVGILISLWILYTGINIYKESYRVLMDEAIDNDSKKKLLEIVKSNKDIIKVGNLYSMPIGYNYLAVLTIFVDGKMSTKNSHDITEELEKEILEKVDRIEKIIIHTEPYIKSKDK